MKHPAILVFAVLAFVVKTPTHAQESSSWIFRSPSNEGLCEENTDATTRAVFANSLRSDLFSLSGHSAQMRPIVPSSSVNENVVNEEIVLRNGSPPTMSPANGMFRFALELGALGSMGWWGFEKADGAGQYALMAGLPIAAALVWGTFTVPSDPSRGKDGLVPVSGITRLLIESAVFGFGTWALHDLGKESIALGYGSAVIVHYSLSFDRLKWLVNQ